MRLLIRRFHQVMTAKAVVCSGPSGSGKSTVINRLFDRYPGCFAFSVSHTTRKPRPGEIDGKDYYFVSRDQMLKAIGNGEFLEHAEFSGNMYGTSKAAVKSIQDTGKICVLDVELQGVRNIRASGLNARFVYVKPPSFEVLEQRLRSRGTETEDAVLKRLTTAKADMSAIEREPKLFDHVIINDEVEPAVDEFVQILKADLESLKKAKNT